MSDVSRDALATVFSALYSPIVVDLIGIVHAYYVPCPITWQHAIPITPVTNENLIEIDTCTERPTQRIEFTRSQHLEGLRTHPLTDCTQSRFLIRLWLGHCPLIRFQSNTWSQQDRRSAEEKEPPSGQNFNVTRKASRLFYDEGKKISEVIFECERILNVLLIRPRSRFEMVSPDMKPFKPFIVPDGYCLEIMFGDYAVVNGAWVRQAEILPHPQSGQEENGERVRPA